MTVPFNSATLSVEPYPHRFDPAMSPVARIDTASALELFVPPPLPQSSYPVVHPHRLLAITSIFTLCMCAVSVSC